SRIIWQGAWKSKLVARLLGWAVLGCAQLAVLTTATAGLLCRMLLEPETAFAPRIGGLMALWRVLNMGRPRGTKKP
ncbi:MAG: hypothetical protein ACKPKO_04295, partial [Candidatus Fonsibacter sp.]